MNDAARVIALMTMLIAGSAANADIRPLLRQQGFDAPLNGRETINYVGHIRQRRNDYQIYTYHGVFRAAEVDHGANAVIVILNGSTFVGDYRIATPAKCEVRGLKVICGRGSIEFTERGPPDRILFDGEVAQIVRGSKLKE